MADDERKDREYNVEELSREELMTKVKSLIASNKKLQSQIRNLQSKATKTDFRKPKQKPFDFSSCSQQKIAIKLAYVGWDYQGFASQDNTDKTIEHELFAALKKTCLIQDRESCEYSRCGRTDKGVSAFGQVISLKVRAEKNKSNNKEDTKIEYTKVLNRVLPPEIKALAWAPVGEAFDARFNCLTRTYKYFFPASDLDIELMRDASHKLIGAHDFRNFCKVDVGNHVNHFIRKIESIEVQSISGNSCVSKNDDMCEITICGMAFLWHQVRCMVSILFLIGLRLEKPEIIDELLNVSNCPKKPQYTMVSEVPLILYDCAFEGIDWIYDSDQVNYNAEYFQNLWTDMAVRKAMVESVLGNLRELQDAATISKGEALFPLMTGHRKRNYKPLMERPVCDGIDRHLEKQAVKRKRLEERQAKKKMKSE